MIMALWTDIIEPAELTGYARESLNAYEARKGTLARWLPNREVLSTFVKFVAGSAGLVEEARYRAYDAEPEVGRKPSGKRVTIELPAVSQEIPVTEYQQLMARGMSDVRCAPRSSRRPIRSSPPSPTALSGPVVSCSIPARPLSRSPTS